MNGAPAAWPFDPRLRQDVADRLLALLPALYRVRDADPIRTTLTHAVVVRIVPRVLTALTADMGAVPAFEVSLDGGATFGATLDASDAVVVKEAPRVTLSFTPAVDAAHVAFVPGDVWWIATDGTATRTAGTGTGQILLRARPLESFLRVLAAPLAEVRQNIEELHGDLFIDTCNDWVIPYLAEMVGTTPIFPDATSNRRDVRGTVGWRRRKGTLRTLEQMGSDLSGQLLVSQEGWKLLMLAQDLNLPRAGRRVADLRDATIAETSSGPLDQSFHAADPRRSSAREGRYLPRDVTHWLHPTRLFPLRGGTARDRGGAADADLRYAFAPLRGYVALRQTRSSPEDTVGTDRIGAMKFAARPGDFFGVRGRFEVRLDGLPGGVAQPSTDLRTASRRAADAVIAGGSATLELLEQQTDRLVDRMVVELCAVPAALPGVPNTAAAVARGGLVLGPGGATSSPGSAAPVANAVAMIRLRPQAAMAAAFFPGAVVEIAANDAAGRRATPDPDLAVEGFLGGALVVRLPPTWVRTERWFFLAADGSLYEAQRTGKNPVDVALPAPVADVLGVHFVALPGDPVAVGPGAAWPPLARFAGGEKLTRMPSAPGAAPVVMHGGAVLRRTATTFVKAGAGDSFALAFAARFEDSSGLTVALRYQPFLRLTWNGPDATAATSWAALDSAGTVLGTAAALGTRFEQIASLREAGAPFLQLVVRLEAASDDFVLPPSEVAWTSDDGETTLIHLPQLDSATPATGAVPWATTFAAAGLGASVGVDGSTAYEDGRPGRYALGAVAPLRGKATLRRRSVRQRSLCQWDRETATDKHPPTREGALDVDPVHGLFALAKAEPPLPYPSNAVALKPATPATVFYQDGYTDHIGARPDARTPLLNALLSEPTRLVMGAGALHRDAPARLHALPRYPTLTLALDAIKNEAKNVPEVVQIEDSATYDETPAWPTGTASLVVQAAESQRPVLRLGAPFNAPAGLHYETLALRGIAIGGKPISLPAVDEFSLQLCTVTDAASTLSFVAPASATLRIERCVTAGLEVKGGGAISLADCVVDATGGKAVDGPDVRLDIERATVFGSVSVAVLEASECIFVDAVSVSDRFHGCIRYSRVPDPAVPCVLPRRHRVVDSKAALRFVQPGGRDRDDPAHARLAADCDPRISRGAEDGTEMGAFALTRLAQRQDALVRRLDEFTPAGVLTGYARLD